MQLKATHTAHKQHTQLAQLNVTHATCGSAPYMFFFRQIFSHNLNIKQLQLQLATVPNEEILLACRHPPKLQVNISQSLLL